MSWCRHLSVAVLVLMGLALANLPRASAQDDRDAAKAHFARGTRLCEVGEYRQAIDEFKAAHLAKPDPAFLFNTGQCHRMLGETEQAVLFWITVDRGHQRQYHHHEVGDPIAAASQTRDEPA